MMLPRECKKALNENIYGTKNDEKGCFRVRKREDLKYLQRMRRAITFDKEECKYKASLNARLLPNENPFLKKR